MHEKLIYQFTDLRLIKLNKHGNVKSCLGGHTHERVHSYADDRICDILLERDVARPTKIKEKYTYLLSYQFLL